MVMPHHTHEEETSRSEPNSTLAAAAHAAAAMRPLHPLAQGHKQPPQHVQHNMASASRPPLPPATLAMQQAASPSMRLKRLESSNGTPAAPNAANGNANGNGIATPYLWDLYDLPPQPHRQCSVDPASSLQSPLQPPPLSRLPSLSSFFPPSLAPQRSGSFPRLMSLVPTPSPEMNMASPSLMPPLERATTEQFAAVLNSPQQQQSHGHPMPPIKYEHHHSHQEHATVRMSDAMPPVMDTACSQCMVESSVCAACIAAKQAQFSHGWLLDSPASYPTAPHTPMTPNYLAQLPLLKQESGASMSTDMNTLPPQLHPQLTLKSDTLMSDVKLKQEEEEEEEKKSSDVSSTAATPALHKQGKLARFLPDGEEESFSGMEPLHLPESVGASSVPYATATDSGKAVSRSGRSLRQRKVRSRSPSPDLSDLSDEEDSASDAQDTEHFGETMDDTLSPPPPPKSFGLVEGGDSSGQSSAEPPAPTTLLPVSASALLPSRPSTAAVPPAHIKDRLVKSAKKLLTAADGVHTAVQVQVIPLWYPRKPTSPAEAAAAAAQQTPSTSLPHKIRLIRVFNTDTQIVSMYVHAADLGGVVERKSNISRLFGKFESPAEKLLMSVVGAHNHSVGQESNVLTSKGVRKFLLTNKMRDEAHYRQWILSVLLPQLEHDPLEIGEEILEIEASTDPAAPTAVKPLRMRRIEKKRQQQQAAAKEAQEKTAAGAGTPSPSSSPAPAAKKQKTVHVHSLHSPPPRYSPMNGAATDAKPVHTPGLKPMQPPQPAASHAA